MQVGQRWPARHGSLSAALEDVEVLRVTRLRVVNEPYGCPAPRSAPSRNLHARSSQSYRGAGERLGYAAEAKRGASLASKRSYRSVENHSGRAPKQTGGLFAGFGRFEVLSRREAQHAGPERAGLASGTSAQGRGWPTLRK